MAYDTIEEKLHALAECGFKLNAPFGVPDLVDSWGSREELDEPGWDLAMVSLGMRHETPPYTPHCNNLWHFDPECISGDGSYARIAKRLSEMTEGSLPLSDLHDHVDVEQRKAWIRFTCRDEPYHFTFAVEDDWADPSIFTRFVELLAKYHANKLFIYYHLGGQDCVIGCTTWEQYEKLKDLTRNVLQLS
jgi:hypothetical protein